MHIYVQLKYMCNGYYVNMFALLGIDCGSLDEPKNGLVLLSGTAEGDTATYSCKPGFVLEPGGENMRVCNHSWNWTGFAPVCRSKSTQFSYIPSCNKC